MQEPVIQINVSDNIHWTGEGTQVVFGTLSGFTELLLGLPLLSDYPEGLVDWLRHDTWSQEEGLVLLLGLDPKGTVIAPSLFINEKKERVDDIQQAQFLDGRIINFPVWCAVFDHLKPLGIPGIDSCLARDVKGEIWQLSDSHRKMKAIWESGNHPARNKPEFFLEWAECEGFDVPWREWYKLQQDKTKSVPGKTLSGDTSGSLEVFRAMKNLTADELNIAFVGDKTELGTGINHMLEISARGHIRRVALAQLGLVNRQRGGLNGEGAILLGIVQNLKLPRVNANATKMSRLRKMFKTHLGITSDPFFPSRKGIGWAPRFTITDKRGAADERAKQDALKYKTDSYEQLTELNEFSEKEGRSAEDGYSTEPLHESSDIDDLATKLLEEN